MVMSLDVLERVLAKADCVIYLRIEGWGGGKQWDALSDNNIVNEVCWGSGGTCNYSVDSLYYKSIDATFIVELKLD